MSRSRTFLAACALLSAAMSFSAPAFAQQGGPPPGGDRRGPGGGPPADRRGPPSVDERVARMTADLGLSAEQATKVRAALTAEQRGMDSVLARRANAQDAERAAVMAMRTNTEKAIGAILTPDQKLKHDAMRARRGGPGDEDRGGRGGRDDRRGPPPGDRRGPPPSDDAPPR